MQYAFIMRVVRSFWILKCSNFRMLESTVEMFECSNALKLVKYWRVFFCLFFLHILVVLVLKILVVGKQKYTHKTLREKCQSLEDLEKRESNKNVAGKYYLLKITISTWVKNKEKLFDVLKRLASDGWLRRWKERNNISSKSVSGESKSVTPEMVNAWSETSLATLLSNHDLKDSYNADEIGRFYQYFPNKTYRLTSEKHYGGKLSITAITTANAMGNKLPMFVIGKVKNPRCFKYVKFLPCRYSNQRKSWMDGKLFEGWSQKGTQHVCIWRKKCCFCDRQLPCPSSYWQPKSNQVVLPTT